MIEVSVVGTEPTEEELKAKSQEELQPMFVAACQQLNAPFTSWNDISHGNTTMTIEDAYNNFPFLASQGYTSAYDLIIKTGVYAEPATFTLNGESITGTSAEFVVTKNSSSDTSYTISATQGSNSGSVTANVTECKIEEYSTICENNTDLKVGTNGLEPASLGDTVVAVCPAGFAYGTSTNVGTVATGLVITDHVEEVTVNEETKRYSNGNEFVWIPIDKDTLSPIGTTNKAMANSAGTQGTLYKISSTGNIVGTEPTLLSSYDTDEQYYKTILGYNSSTDFGNAITSSYSSMIASVKQYGGFYVGRYEMGQVSGNYSKIGITPTSAYDSETSTWYKLYKKANEYTIKTSVKSQMIWGSQYDAMLNFALSNGNDSSKVDVNTNGNHSGRLLKTGTWTGSDSINNIYDLEGNLFEWTQEAYDTDFRVGRGGNIFGTSSPSYRSSDFDPDNTSSGFGSRIGLYIK